MLCCLPGFCDFMSSFFLLLLFSPSLFLYDPLFKTFSFLLCIFWFGPSSHFYLSYFSWDSLLFFFFFYSSLFSLAAPCSSCVSVPMVVCSVHPPASHSAPSFLRQYAGHLGRTALRREPGGALERDRAFLSLHRTGSLGIHTQAHTMAMPYEQNYNKKIQLRGTAVNRIVTLCCCLENKTFSSAKKSKIVEKFK